MLLSKTVKIKWNAKIKKHYENKGYIYTKMNDEFEVKTEDLTNGSHARVYVKCDNPICENPFLPSMTWGNYKHCVSDNGKYYCKKCAINLFASDNSVLTRLKNNKSFEQWCIENNRQDVLERWDYELNGYKPNEVNYSTNKKYWFKCPRGLHESELKKISDFTYGKGGSIVCKKCNSFAQYLIDLYGENALTLYWDYEKNILDPWEMSYGSHKDKVWIICQEKEYHGSYSILPKQFSSRGERCYYCSTRQGRVHILDSLGSICPDVIKIWSDKNIKKPYFYTLNSEREVWWKCENGVHEDYKRSVNSSNNYHFRCPECVRERNESFLQEKVRLYLESLRYKILHEHNCSIVPINPKTKKPLPYDNEINELKLIIEVHGEQHYKESSGKWFNKNLDFHKRQLYDRYKRIYAKSKDYNYLEIPYWTDNKKEEWKKLIDNKINEFTNKQ